VAFVHDLSKTFQARVDLKMDLPLESCS
jgi:hypothetical protein